MGTLCRVTPPDGTAAAIVLAGGLGERLRRDEPKAFVPLAGASILERSLRAVVASGAFDAVVVVVPKDRVDEAERLLERCAPSQGVVAVGGESRRESVRRGLERVPPDADVVVCHDAARPFASPALHAAVVAALRAGRAADARADGVIPVIPPSDTIKRVEGGVVTATVRRETVALAQTPQAFDAAVLRACHERVRGSAADVTDDAMLLEAAGHRVIAIDGEASNFKITSAEDLARAEGLVGPPAAPTDADVGMEDVGAPDPTALAVEGSSATGAPTEDPWGHVWDAP